MACRCSVMIIHADVKRRNKEKKMQVLIVIDMQNAVFSTPRAQQVQTVASPL